MWSWSVRLMDRSHVFQHPLFFFLLFLVFPFLCIFLHQLAGSMCQTYNDSMCTKGSYMPEIVGLAGVLVNQDINDERLSGSRNLGHTNNTFPAHAVPSKILGALQGVARGDHILSLMSKIASQISVETVLSQAPAGFCLIVQSYCWFYTNPSKFYASSSLFLIAGQFTQ